MKQDGREKETVMIPKSEHYALVDYFGTVIARGSNASMKKLSRIKGGTIYVTSTPVGGKV